MTPKYMTDMSIDTQKALELFIEEVQVKVPEAEIQ